MSIFKKASAGVVASAMILSLSACSTNLWGADITYAATIDGVKIPAGIFISRQFDAYYEASIYVDPNESTETTTTAEGEEAVTTAFTDKIIEGKAVEEWINDKATKSIREYAAIESKFEELGLSFTDNEEKKIEVSMESIWDYYGEIYEDMGVSKKSQTLLALNTTKDEYIFNYYYGKGGINEVSEADIKAYLTDNNARINYIEMVLKDGEGNLLKSDGKSEIMDMAKDYVERANNGEDFNALLKEYNDYYDALVEAATASDETTDTTETTPETETDPDNTTVISKDGTFPSAGVVERVFDGTSKTGDVFIVEENEEYYVVQILDLFADETYYDNNAESALHALKDEEYNAMVDEWIAAQTFEKNEAAYKAYKIDKFLEE